MLDVNVVRLARLCAIVSYSSDDPSAFVPELLFDLDA
jgi:hypothetical protein